MAAEKPIGKFKCLARGLVSDGAQLLDDPRSTAVRWTCGDAFCGGTAYRVAEKARA